MSDSSPTQAVEMTNSGRGGTWRPIAAVICLVLAVLLTTPALIAYWGPRTLNDSFDVLSPVCHHTSVPTSILLSSC